MNKKIDAETLALTWRRTKIVATLGPASSSVAMIESLLQAGVDVVRLNMSHGDHDGHRALVASVRATAARTGKHVAIVMDLCGPKIRVGEFETGAIELRKNQRVTVTSRKLIGSDALIPSQYHNLHKDVQPKQRILLDDGNLELRVEVIDGTEIHCRVIYGGLLKNHKGMNLPDSTVSTAAFTAKDKTDASLAAELKVDFLALSFVRSAGDVLRLKKYLAGLRAEIPVISKIERPEAVKNIEEILQVSDGIMVARGDLGIELPAEQVPIIQRDLIEAARKASTPVIVATQMLESMIEHSRPTRAEVGDVANAAQLGADAVMLSAETASGKYPVQAVAMMDKVLREIERHQWRAGRFSGNAPIDRRQHAQSTRQAIANAAHELARDLGLQAIVIPTFRGSTARIVASHRPTAPMVSVSSDARICRQLSLLWGVIPVQAAESETHNWRALSQQIAPACRLTDKGHRVLIVAGFHDDPMLNEPVLKVIKL